MPFVLMENTEDRLITIILLFEMCNIYIKTLIDNNGGIINDYISAGTMWFGTSFLMQHAFAEECLVTINNNRL